MERSKKLGIACGIGILGIVGSIALGISWQQEAKESVSTADVVHSTEMEAEAGMNTETERKIENGKEEEVLEATPVEMEEPTTNLLAKNDAMEAQGKAVKDEQEQEETQEDNGEEGNTISLVETETGEEYSITYDEKTKDIRTEEIGETISALQKQYVDTQLVVKSEKLSEAELAHCTEQIGDFYVLEYADAEEAAEAKEKYENMRSVEEVEYVRIVTICDTGEENYEYLSYGPQQIKSDVFVDRILEEKGGVEALPEIVVAVIDTGIDYSHPFLQGRVISSSYDFIEGDDSTMDEYGHGTHVAGIIADTTTENVKVKAYQALAADGYGTDISVAQAIEQAVADGVDVINMSLGNKGDGESAVQKVAMDKAIEAGIVVVVAAGNESADAGMTYPASYPDAITVSAVDQNQVLGYYSNYGMCIDLCAPGNSVTSAVPGGEYATETGTSMATPFVSAAVALLRTYDADISNNQVLATLRQSAIDLGEEGWDRQYGYGQVCLENIQIVDMLDAPVFSVEGGMYENAVTVELSVSGDAAIYYTLDGSYPSKEKGILYTDAIQITESTAISAVAVDPAGIMKDSAFTIEKYYINGQLLESDFEITEEGDITAYYGTLSELVIPEVIQGITVTGLDMCFYNAQSVQKVVIPDSVIYLKPSCFMMSNVETVTIGKGVAYIGDLCFANASYLQEIILDEENPYYNLIDDVLYTENGDELLYYARYKEDNEYRVLEGTRYIRELALKEISATVLYFPSTFKGVTYENGELYNIYYDTTDRKTRNCQIFVSEDNPYFSSDEYGVLYNKDKTILYNYPGSLANTEFTVPSTVEILYAFSCHWAKFETINLPPGLRKIESWALSGIDNMKSIVIPRNVEIIEMAALGGHFLENIYFEGDITEGVNDIFLSENEQTVLLHYYGEATGYERFAGHYNLKERTDGGYVSTRIKYAVNDDFSLLFNTETGTIYGYEGTIEDLVIPDTINGVTVRTIEQDVFRETDIISVVIPDTVTYLGEMVFYQCSALTSVTIGEGVKIIPQEAFGNCTVLQTVELGNDVSEIGNSAFYATPELENIELPSSVWKIGANAFGHCYCLNFSDLPENLEYIGNSAFSYCNFNSILIVPEKVRYIDKYAFEWTNTEYVCIASDEVRIDKNMFVNLEGNTNKTPKYICFWGDISRPFVKAFPKDVTIIHRKDAKGFDDRALDSYKKIALDKVIFDMTVKDNQGEVLEQKELYAYQSFTYDLDSIPVNEEEDATIILINNMIAEKKLVMVEHVVEDIAIEVYYTLPAQLESCTPDSITLVSYGGAEYSLDGANWQSENVFTGLNAQEYTVHIRYVLHGNVIEIEETLPVDLSDVSARIPKPVVATDRMVILEAYEGYEYSRDGKNWQSSSIFTGLEGVTDYNFYQRKAGSETMSQPLELTTPDMVEAYPGEILSEVAERLPKGLTFETLAGENAEDVSGMEEGAEYVYTVSYLPEGAEAEQKFTGIELTVVVIRNPELIACRDDAVLLEFFEDYVYSVDKENWIEDSVISQLQEGMEYTVYQKRQTGTLITEQKVTLYETEFVIEAVYGEKLWDYKEQLPTDYEFVDEEETTVGNAGENTFSIVAGTSNSSGILYWTVKVNVAKAIPQYLAPEIVEVLPCEALSEATARLPEGFSFEVETESFSFPEEPGEYTYTIMYIPADTANYEIVTGINMTVIVLSSPEIVTYTDSMVLLEECEGYEYSMDGVNWQNSPLFTDLQAETEYSFCQRRLGGSRISETVKVITLQEKTEEPVEVTFADVPMDTWKYEPALYAYKRGIMAGTGVDESGNIIFEPDTQLTREQFTQVLYNLEGGEKVTYHERFTDVEDGKWYTSSILWAAEKGIVSGYDEDTFGVGDEITREQMASMLYQYAKYKGYSTEAVASFEQFTDAEQISPWAVTQLKWAVGNGVMSGKGTILDPVGTALRAECAAMLSNFMTAFEIP